MAIVLDGSSSAGLLNLGTNGTISNLAVGGLPDGIVDTDMLATNAVATAKIADDAVTAAKATGLGIAEADHWRVTAAWTGNANPISSNWERCDTTPGLGKIGTGLTESSGVFSFPSTGIWQIWVGFCWYATDSQTYSAITIVGTTNNFSSSENTFELLGSGAQASNQHGFSFTSGIFDVTDTSNIKFRLNANSGDGADTEWRGDSSISKNYVIAVKYAET